MIRKCIIYIDWKKLKSKNAFMAVAGNKIQLNFKTPKKVKPLTYVSEELSKITVVFVFSNFVNVYMQSSNGNNAKFAKQAYQGKS